jgi:hypothetical protein
VYIQKLVPLSNKEAILENLVHEYKILSKYKKMMIKRKDNLRVARQMRMNCSDSEDDGVVEYFGEN